MNASAPTLTSRELNRAVLARQLLLERSDRSIPSALEAVGGIQDQYAPAGYVALWSRLAGFARADLTRALEERRVIQATLMRSTIHLVSAADYWPMAIGLARSRREWWLRVQRGALAGVDMDAVAARVRALLADGPRRQAEIVAALEADGMPRIAWSGVGVWLDLVRVPPSGTWERRRADLYGLAEDWLPRPSGIGEDDGLDLLLRRYLEGFGPAPLADAANWAGLRATTLRAAAERLDLRRFRDERGRAHLDLPDAPRPPADTPAPVRFLPVWEAVLLVHARRTLVLAEQHRARIFNTKNPQSFATFLVDGVVAGTWRWDADGRRIAIDPFEPLPRAVRHEVDEEAERLAAFHAD